MIEPPRLPHVGSQRVAWNRTQSLLRYRSNNVDAVVRTRRLHPEISIGTEQFRIGWNVISGFVVFQSPDRLGSFHLLKISDAGGSCWIPAMARCKKRVKDCDAQH